MGRLDAARAEAGLSMAAEIAVVVMSYGERPTLASALASLAAQTPHPEIVVVHSGPGEPERALAGAGVGAQLIRGGTRLYPGAARNAGIDATTAPIVAFLADDCVARPNWIAARLAAHEAGAATVASALICHQPRNPIAMAAHLSLYVRRLPGAAPDLALRYGLSYQRALFDRYGRFRDDIEGGEDTDFNQRLSSAEAPAWRPDVQTIHHGPETLTAFLHDQYRRGQRMAASWAALGAHTSGDVAKNAVDRTGRIMRESLRFSAPEDRATVWAALPFIALGNLAYARGALRSRPDA